MKSLRVFAISLLFWTTPAIQNAMGEVPSAEYRIVTLTTGLKETLRGDPSWRMCGNYFARKENGGKKIVFFGFEKLPSDNPSASTFFAFTNVEWMDAPLIHDRVAAPTVFVLETERGKRFFLKMNMKDYKIGLPCLGKGTNV